MLHVIDISFSASSGFVCAENTSRKHHRTKDLHLAYSKMGEIWGRNQMIKSEKFQYFSIKSYAVDVYKNRLTEAILIHIQNI